MPKQSNDDPRDERRPSRREGTPPRLSDEMIAKLQGAVSAARRKHGARESAARDVGEDPVISPEK